MVAYQPFYARNHTPQTLCTSLGAYRRAKHWNISSNKIKKPHLVTARYGVDLVRTSSARWTIKNPYQCARELWRNPSMQLRLYCKVKGLKTVTVYIMKSHQCWSSLTMYQMYALIGTSEKIDLFKAVRKPGRSQEWRFLLVWQMT